MPPMRGGELQGDTGQWHFAVVAHGEQRANGKMLLGGAQPHIQIEIGEGNGAPVGVFGCRLRGHLGRGLGGRRVSGGGGLAVLVDGAGKDDLAFGLLVRRRRSSLRKA